MLRNPWHILSHFPFSAVFLEPFIIQLAQVLQHRSGFSQTRQNFPAGHLWLHVKFQFPQPASPFACQPLSSQPALKLTSAVGPPLQCQDGCGQCRQLARAFPHLRKSLASPNIPIRVRGGWVGEDFPSIPSHQEHRLCLPWQPCNGSAADGPGREPGSVCPHGHTLRACGTGTRAEGAARPSHSAQDCGFRLAFSSNALFPTL